MSDNGKAKRLRGLLAIKRNRLVAFALIAAAVLWIGSGYIVPREHAESEAAIRADGGKPKAAFRVAVIEAKLAEHSRKLTLSGRTEAYRKVMAVARTNGMVAKLNVRRGSLVAQGEIIAVLSDEAREAQVLQAKALVVQRQAELDAKRRLSESGAVARLDLANTEAQYKAAQAAQAAAEAEAERGNVVAPWSGIITDVPTEIGQALSPGKEVAQIVALDPMLAVVEVAEKKLAGVTLGETAKIRLITGVEAEGRIRYVSKSANGATRTYRVEVEIANADGTIPDGITAEVSIRLAPEKATRIPRSALTFSTTGDLGVRMVDAQNKVGFLPVAVAQDEQVQMWVTGIPDGAKVIVQGQDFVREGQTVEAVLADPEKTAAK